jgi:hypothetical protein
MSIRWQRTAHTFTCATVSTGSGCLLPLTFAPTVVAGGTLTLSYRYTDNAGTAKTGALNLAYAATDTNNLVGTAAPSGQINAVIGGPARQWPSPSPPMTTTSPPRWH